MNATKITALALGLFATAAFGDVLPTFQDLDANGDGRLSVIELEVMEQFTGEDSEFVEADANGNGSIDAAEYANWSEQESEALAAEAAARERAAKN